MEIITNNDNSCLGSNNNNCSKIHHNTMSMPEIGATRNFDNQFNFLFN